MAILIKKGPVCQPAAVKLPARVKVIQSLASTQSKERAVITYSLATSHNVVFDPGDAKETTRIEAVTSTTQEFVHHLQLKTKGGGPPNVATVSIKEKVEGETGTAKTAVCGVAVS